MNTRTTRRRFAHRAGLMLAALVDARATVTLKRGVTRSNELWPSKLEIGALSAGASAITLETVTIVAEQIERVPT